jgi:polar amino acid transport system substrate-binding protein
MRNRDVGTGKRLLSVVAPVLAVALIAGCGSSGSSSSSSSSSSSTPAATSSTSAASTSSTGADAAVEALVPAAIKAKGTIVVASDASYPPFEYIGADGHTVVGSDADLAHALAQVMGLKANVINVTFDAIIPGLQAGKYDMGASGFGDTVPREKVVNFVDYGKYFESLFTKATGGTDVTSMADLCGKTVAVESTTTEQADAQTQSGKCTAAGKPKVNILVFPTQTAANLALISGRAQLGFADSPVASYEVQQTHGELKVVGSGPVASSGPYGLAFPKNSGLDKAAEAALLVLMKNGTYQSIFKHWGIVTTGIPASDVKINGAGS